MKRARLRSRRSPNGIMLAEALVGLAVLVTGLLAGFHAVSTAGRTARLMDVRRHEIRCARLRSWETFLDGALPKSICPDVTFPGLSFGKESP